MSVAAPVAVRQAAELRQVRARLADLEDENRQLRAQRNYLRELLRLTTGCECVAEALESR